MPYFSDPVRERDRLRELKRSQERRKTERRTSFRKARRDRNYHKRSLHAEERASTQSNEEAHERRVHDHQRRVDNNRENRPQIIVIPVSVGTQFLIINFLKFHLAK